MDFNQQAGKVSLWLTLKSPHQYIKDSKVEICRGGRSTIAVEAITVEAITVEVIAAEAIAVGTITVEAITVHLGGVSIDICC